MNLVKELEKWKKDLEELGIEKGKAEGRLEQAMADLKALGFETLEAAKIELDRLLALKEAKEEGARQLLAGFKEKYKDFIEV